MAICREELIDYEDIVVVIDLMSANDEITFHYCGARAIHQKVTSLGLQEERIDYLGWLDNPEDKILCCFDLRPKQAAPWAHGWRGYGCRSPNNFP